MSGCSTSLQDYKSQPFPGVDSVELRAVEKSRQLHLHTFRFSYFITEIQNNSPINVLKYPTVPDSRWINLLFK